MTPETDTFLMRQVIVGEPLGKGEGKITASGFTDENASELANTINERYMVDVSPDAPGCCIDGRCAVHTMAGEGTMLELGPHVSGGTLLTAFGAAELVSEYYGEQDADTVFERLEAVKATLIGAGIKLGAHVTTGAVANSFKDENGNSQTGCGLNDKFKIVMTKPADEKEFVNGTTALLLGDAYNADSMKFKDQTDIEERIKEYDSKQALDVLVGPEKAFDSVEVLAGEHAETLVVFNYVEGKTVDRDAVVKETGKQVFVVDMWYLDKLATVMSAGRPDAVEMRSKLQHAMTAFQVGTYLTLCDGTHRPVILKPQEEIVPAV